jgi:hypothetical protein
VCWQSYVKESRAPHKRPPCLADKSGSPAKKEKGCRKVAPEGKRFQRADSDLVIL